MLGRGSVLDTHGLTVLLLIHMILYKVYRVCVLLSIYNLMPNVKNASSIYQEWKLRFYAPFIGNFFKDLLHHRRLIDNGPMEGFWGILKRESILWQEVSSSKQELVRMIQDYIVLLATPSAVQRNLGVGYANGKVPDGIFCVKKSAKMQCAWHAKILILFHLYA